MVSYRVWKLFLDATFWVYLPNGAVEQAVLSYGQWKALSNEQRTLNPAAMQAADLWTSVSDVVKVKTICNDPYGHDKIFSMVVEDCEIFAVAT